MSAFALAARFARRAAVGGLALLGLLLAGALALAATALYALRAHDGEWSVHAGIGPFSMSFSVPALVRVATHSLGIRALAGRRVPTPFGPVRFEAGATPASLRLRCAPCTIDARAVAAKPIAFSEVTATVEPGEPNQWRGELRAGAVSAQWRAKLAAQTADLELRLPDTKIADLVALFGSAVPEAGRARIEGEAGAVVRLALPSRRFAIEPRLQGLVVEGLGTDALLAASPLPACARSPRGRRSAEPFGPWLPKAVVAAEDQRFYEHAGYDVAEMAAAWSSELPPGRSPERRRGASTLSQQLAKMLYTGDDRSAARKVRELLYAAELDRTLGKARVLQLYLAVAPWGDGQCGGEAAALHYFGKPAAKLEATEAVWLAGLLRNPERELERSAQALDTERLATLAGALRPLPRAKREALQAELAGWSPPPVVAMRAASGVR